MTIEYKLNTDSRQSQLNTDNDIYTPPEATDQIVPFIPDGVRTIWECCYGKGHMARRLRGHNYFVIGDPAVDARMFYERYRDVDAVITNPPFQTSLRLGILEAVLRLEKPTAFIIRIEHIGGQSMYKLIERIRPLHPQYIIPSGRINYIQPLSGEKSNCSFHSVWVTFNFKLERDIVHIKS